jgi:diguanylate cyclase
MHAMAAIRAEVALPAPRDLFAAVGAFLTRHGLGAHPANYAFAFSVVNEPDSALADEVARIEEGGFRLTADDIERLGGVPARGEPVAVPAATPAADAGDRAEAIVERTRTQVEGFTRAVRDIRDQTRGFGDDLAATIELRSRLKVIDEATALTTAMIERVRQAEVRLEVATCEAETLREELEQARGDARRDPLTGLANRRAFAEAFAALSPGEDAAIAICDVDRFKAVNDMFGHAIGDRVLRAVGRTIAEECEGCVTARYGGEEFVILVPGDDPVGVIEAARRRVAGKRFRLRDTDALLGTITFSAGLARVGQGEALEGALARADASLYLAKANGRNQVQIAD